MATYNISTLAQLQAISPDHLADDCQLLADIDATATSGWNAGAGFVPIRGFTGSFDGNDHTITNLFINRPGESYVGLFGSAGGENMAISNTKLVNVNITGNSYVGGLAGYYSSDSNCWGNSTTGTVVANTTFSSNSGGLIGYATGTVSIYDCYSTCSVYGYLNVGGLVGNIEIGNENGISNSYATGDVHCYGEAGGGMVGLLSEGTISRSYATGNVGSTSRIGGFVGDMAIGRIENCYATGNVTAPYAGGFVGIDQTSAITNCYSTGAVSGTHAGGFVGEKGEATLTNCFSVGTVSGTYAGGFSGSLVSIDYYVNCGFWTGCGKDVAIYPIYSITYEENLKSAFYDKTHNLYDTTSPVWDFTTPVWYQWSSYPMLRKYMGRIVIID